MLLNPEASVRVERVAGDVPVLYIEDFYADPERVRADALRAAYDQSVALYPGRHAPIRSPELDEVKRQLCAIMTAIGDQIYEPDAIVSDFSILTAKPDQLLGAQKHPHIDPGPVLGLVYLNPHDHQGTCFFRNRRLGTHVIRGTEQQDALLRFLAEEGPTYEPDGYDLTGNEVWEKIYTIEGKWNRFVMYPGNVFHSIDVRHIPERFDMETVRLTQRFLVSESRPKMTSAL